MLGELAIQLLAALGAALFASLAGTRPAALALLAAAFLVGAAIGDAPDATPVIAGGVFVAAAVFMLRPRWSIVAPAAAGFCAGSWATLLSGQGLPIFVAWGVGIALIVAALRSSRRASFMPALVRDEALVAIGAAALVIAVGAEITAGWRSAVALSGGPLEGGAPDSGVGLMAVVVAAVLAGGGWSWWKRR